MNEKIKKIKKQYEEACNAWVLELLKAWELSPEDGWWVSDEVGDIYCHAADVSLNMNDIIFCVENNVSLEKYWDYIEYSIKCNEYNFNTPNLKGYVRGCPLVPQETFDKLEGLKKEIEKCVKETNNLF